MASIWGRSPSCHNHKVEKCILALIPVGAGGLKKGPYTKEMGKKNKRETVSQEKEYGIDGGKKITT